MTKAKKIETIIDDYDYIEYELEHSTQGNDSSLKKKKRLDPYKKEKERRNSKIDPRFLEFDEDEY